jgi:flagellar assembly protein FliH
MSLSKVARASFSEKATHFLTHKEIRQPIVPESQEAVDQEMWLVEKLARLEGEIASKQREINEATEAFQARIQAEREQFSQDLNRERENVLKEAFSEGFNKGHQEGLNAWEEKIRQANLVLEKSIEEAHAYLDQSEPTILNLALAISEKIVGETLQTEESWRSLVKQAIREMRETSPIKILVAPERVTATRSALDSLKEITYGSDILVFSDTELSQNACLVESPSGRLDAGVSSQLNQLKMALTDLLGSAPYESS